MQQCSGDNLQLILKIGWITGFVDGEGCFSINFIRQPARENRRGYTTGFQVAHEFAVTQGEKSFDSLQMLGQFFGVGAVYVNRRYDNHKEHIHRYCVRKRSDLIQRIVPFFTEYPLRTAKRSDFNKFVRCLTLIEAKSHLTKAGLLHIVRIVETMNHCRPRAEIIDTLSTDAGTDLFRSA